MFSAKSSMDSGSNILGITKSSITFFVNGSPYTVSAEDDIRDIGSHSRLVDFIRDQAGLTGTKWMCREGGCGSCVVGLRSVTENAATGEVNVLVLAVNSCLIPVLSCDGMDIITVEGVGNAQQGYDPIQERLAAFGGTQCGFCSSGMVMNMFSLMKSNENGHTMKEIEDSFDGNICRCTGYRPILEAFKTFGTDASPHLLKKCAGVDQDIEDLGLGCKLRMDCSDKKTLCRTEEAENVLFCMPKTGEKWTKVLTLEGAFQALEYFKENEMKGRIVAGNTGSGVFKDDLMGYTGFVDVGNIQELKKIEIGPGNLLLGSGVTLANAIIAFKSASHVSGYEHTIRLSKNIGRVANSPVRNRATLGGNLMLKRNHPEFSSDLFTIFEAAGAALWIATSSGDLKVVSVAEFLKLDMTDKIVKSIYFPPWTDQHAFRTFKISRRFQSSHAYVNAAFLMKLDGNLSILEQPRIVFGGISKNFVHANRTEVYLTGKSLNDPVVLSGAMSTLSEEVNPDLNPGQDGSFQHRKLLPQSLLYKFILGVLKWKKISISLKLQSGGSNIKRKVTSAQQTYDTDPSIWPVNQPVIKLESMPQVSGAAEYFNDIQPKYGELFAAFVLSTVAKADIVQIDASDAHEIPSVVGFFEAKDIPGSNTYLQFGPNLPGIGNDEIFASSKVSYHGQSLGLIVAETQEIANKAAKLVRVEYANVEQGVFSIPDAIHLAKANGTYKSMFKPIVKSSQVSDENPSQWIKGEFSMGGQYAFHLENQIAICHPTEDGMDLYSSSQFLDLVQGAVAFALKIPNNEINIKIRRLGGSFGAKATRAGQVATACAVAAHLLRRPVRLALDLATNMSLMGKRFPYYMKYRAGVNQSGAILQLKAKIFGDGGMSANELYIAPMITKIQNTYRAIGWEIQLATVITNTAPNTWTRAPSVTPAIAFPENLMEHVAFQLKLNPLKVRKVNMFSPGDKIFPPRPGGGGELVESQLAEDQNLIKRMIKELKFSGNYKDRMKFVADFNQNNRWSKRGMALVPMRYPISYLMPNQFKLPAFVAIYKNDATVAVSHGGIEMGQGINTKIAQVVAREFGIPIDKIRIKPFNNLSSPNSYISAISITSELCCFAAMTACKILKQRMSPVMDKFHPKTWTELIQLCYKNNIELSASYVPTPNDGLKPEYNVWVANLTEVEIDVLTGEYKIVRMDVIEDAGQSLNPAIDIGQVEGSVVFGLGYWTTEKLLYDKESGQLLSNGTWLYKPPLPKDIPEDFRVTLVKSSRNPGGVLSSKATGEPALPSTVAVLFALKNAIYSARVDAGHVEWFTLNGPVTVEDVLMKCLTTPDQFVI